MFDIRRPITGVRVFENFWAPDLCDTTIRQAEAVSFWEAAAIGRYQDDKVVASSIDKDFRDVQVLNLENSSISNPFSASEDLLLTVNREFGCDAKRISRSMMSKYSIGSHIRSHKDTGAFDTSRLVTLVLYLNERYDGGVLYFPDLSLELKPSMGCIVAFYSELRHGVSKISSGTRYCIVGFAENDAAYRRS